MTRVFVDKPAIADLHARARSIRHTVLEMAQALGHGYAGQGLEIADLLAALYFSELRFDPANLAAPGRDRFVLSTGHMGIGLLATLGELGILDHDELLTYGQPGSRIEQSPLYGVCPGFEITGGSLGMGLSQAIGMALGERLNRHESRVYCMLSDGELQEGATWEAALCAAHYKLDNLVALIDANGIQADGDVARVLAVEPIAAKWRAFNWHAIEVPGHDMAAILAALDEARARRDQPTVLVCATTPCKGVPSLEQRARVHYVRLTPEEWVEVIREFEGQL